MQTVDIPLNHYTYRFRKLVYEEEFALEVAVGGDSRKAVLQSALVSVSSLAIDSRAQAAEILSASQTPQSPGSGSYTGPGERLFSTWPLQGTQGDPGIHCGPIHRFAVQTRPALY